MHLNMMKMVFPGCQKSRRTGRFPCSISVWGGGDGSHKKCPACKGQICGIIATAGGRVTLKAGCHECGRIVKLEGLL